MTTITPAGTYAFETLDEMGFVCCGDNRPDFPHCPRCSDNPVRTLRTAVPQDDFTPPDPYAEPLKKMRAGVPVPSEAPKPPCPFDTPGYTGQPNSIPPDPYAAGIAKLRKETK